MYLLRHRLALIRTVGNLGEEVARITRLLKVLALIALIAVFSLTALQVACIISNDQIMFSKLSLDLLATRTAVQLILLILYLIVTA